MQIYLHANAVGLMPKSGVSPHNVDIDKDGNYSVKTTPDGSWIVYDGTQPPTYLARDLESIPLSKEQYNLYMDRAFDNEKNANSVQTKMTTSGYHALLIRDPVLANITSTAEDLECIHLKILQYADKMINDGLEGTKITVEYDKDYDVKSLAEKMDNIKKAIEMNIPSPTLYKEIYKEVATNMIGDEKIRDIAYSEIDTNVGKTDESEINRMVGDEMSGNIEKLKANLKMGGKTDEEIEAMLNESNNN